MKPVSSPTTTAANLARNAAPSADNSQGANFASLFSSLSSAQPQNSPAPARAPQKANQSSAGQNAAQAQQVKDGVEEPACANKPDAGATAASPAPAKEARSDDDKAAADTPAAADAARTPDAAAQLLALAQQIQGPALNGPAASAEKGNALTDAPADKRGHAQRATAKADPLAGTRATETEEPGAGKAAPQTDFIGHIADAQALQHAKAANASEEMLLTSQSAQDKAVPQAGAPVFAGAASAAATANAARAVSDQLAPRVGAAGWDRALGQKVVWMVGQGEQSASLTLNPPDLGPLQVVLTISQSQASADFSAAQPEVRQALQDALPRLRDMLADAGISLGQANVHSGTGEQSQQAQQGSQDSGGQRGMSSRADSQSASGEDSRIARAPQRVGLGLVNTYV